MTATGDVLLVDTDSRVRTLTLNRPQARNALSADLQTATGLWLEAAAGRQWLDGLSGGEVAANREAVLQRGRDQVR